MRGIISHTTNLSSAACTCAMVTLLAFSPPMVRPVAAQVGTTVPIVVAAGGQVVGTATVSQSVDVAWVAIPTEVGPVTLLVKPDSLVGNENVVFALPDCAGDGYLANRTPGALFRSAGIGGPNRALYVDAGLAPVEILVQSVSWPGQPCHNIAEPRLNPQYRTHVADPNIESTYPPPYHVELRVVSTGPDIVIGVLTTSPAAPTSASTTTVKVTTKNIGAETVGTSNTRLYLSLDASVGPEDEVLAEFAVIALPPGGFRTHSIDVTLPAGTRYLIAVADVEDEQAESKETNNTKKVLKTVR